MAEHRHLEALHATDGSEIGEVTRAAVELDEVGEEERHDAQVDVHRRCALENDSRDAPLLTPLLLAEMAVDGHGTHEGSGGGGGEVERGAA